MTTSKVKIRINNANQPERHLVAFDSKAPCNTELLLRAHQDWESKIPDDALHLDAFERRTKPHTVLPEMQLLQDILHPENNAMLQQRDAAMCPLNETNPNELTSPTAHDIENTVTVNRI